MTSYFHILYDVSLKIFVSIYTVSPVLLDTCCKINSCLDKKRKHWKLKDNRNKQTLGLRHVPRDGRETAEKWTLAGSDKCNNMNE
jgi:hypothetical protein